MYVQLGISLSQMHDLVRTYTVHCGVTVCYIILTPRNHSYKFIGEPCDTISQFSYFRLQ